MANALSFGAPCHTFWGGLTRGAECAYENRQDEIYQRYVRRDNALFSRAQGDRKLLLEQFSEIGKGLMLFILIAAFLLFYFKD